MNRRGILLFTLVFLVCLSSSYANITNLVYADDGDGAFVCSNPGSWSGSTNELSVGVTGKQCWAPGHLLLNIYTDGADDPTLKNDNSIENDTSFAWTEFTVNLTMAVQFTLTNVDVSVPGSWSVVSFDQTANYTGSNYLATVVYNTGPAIPNDGTSTIDFGYWVKFSGSPSYVLTQEMIPVPEPSTLVLLAFGGLFLARFASRRSRK